MSHPFMRHKDRVCACCGKNATGLRNLHHMVQWAIKIGLPLAVPRSNYVAAGCVEALREAIIRKEKSK